MENIKIIPSLDPPNYQIILKTAVVGADEVICRKVRNTTTIEGNKESVRSTFSSRTWSSAPGVKWRKRRWRQFMTFIPLKQKFRPLLLTEVKGNGRNR